FRDAPQYEGDRASCDAAGRKQGIDSVDSGDAHVLHVSPVVGRRGIVKRDCTQGSESSSFAVPTARLPTCHARQSGTSGATAAITSKPWPNDARGNPSAPDSRCGLSRPLHVTRTAT